MRHLSSDEVCGLQSFLVADNDEAVGIELHIGKDYRRGYDDPDRIEKYSLAELDGHELIEAGDVTLCALVGDRLYYRDKWGYDHSTAIEYAYRGVNQQTQDYLYIRSMVSYSAPIVTLPKEDIIPLSSIRVEGNKRVRGVKLIHGSRGIGGSNTSGFCPSSDEPIVYTTEMLDGHEIIYVEGTAMCALVGDVLYFRHTRRDGETNVFTLNYRDVSCTLMGDGIAYDTVEATRVVLLLDEK